MLDPSADGKMSKAGLMPRQSTSIRQGNEMKRKHYCHEGGTVHTPKPKPKPSKKKKSTGD